MGTLAVTLILALYVVGLYLVYQDLIKAGIKAFLSQSASYRMGGIFLIIIATVFAVALSAKHTPFSHASLDGLENGQIVEVMATDLQVGTNKAVVLEMVQLEADTLAPQQVGWPVVVDTTSVSVPTTKYAIIYRAKSGALGEKIIFLPYKPEDVSNK